MTSPATVPAKGLAWRRHLLLAGAFALVGALTHAAGPRVPVQVQVVTLGAGLVAASFILAWAADAGDAVFSGRLVLASVALVTVLPEFIVEVRFAFIQAAELVTANLTGATRLLLTGATALPLVTAAVARRRREPDPPIVLSPHRRLELGVLLVAALFAVDVAVQGDLTIAHGIVLIGLYVLYAWRLQGSPDETPAVGGVPAGLLTLPPVLHRVVIAGLMVFAAAVVVAIANPFADALLATGGSLGIDPYLLIQSVVPLATEAPEVVVVAVLVANHRPAQGLALFLAASVSQWTLGMGSLPVAYLLGGGGPSLPLAGREQVELGFTIAVTLFVVAALVTLRPERVDAYLVAGVFVVQTVQPSTVVRAAAGFVLLVVALDLLASRHRAVGPLLGAVFRRRRPPG